MGKPGLHSSTTRGCPAAGNCTSNVFFNVSDPDPHHPGYGSALEMRIADPDPAAIK